MGLSASMTQTDLAEGFAVRRDRHEGDSWRAAEMARGRRLKRRASSQLIWMMRGGRAEVGPLLALKALSKARQGSARTRGCASPRLLANLEFSLFIAVTRSRDLA